MTIAEMLLPRLNEWESTGPGRQQWSQALADSGWTVHLEAERVDTLGCLLREATLLRTRSSDAVSNAALKERAGQIAERVTGLMEPLHFLELDDTKAVALLRSDVPARRGAALSYYEILMTQGRKIELKRYQVDSAKGGRRTQVAFALTHEAIAKLVDDLVRD
jgi:hypothetical protein